MMRLLMLFACLLAGIGIGALGESITGSQAWYLAVPLLVAAVWLFVADPSQCAARRR